MVRIIEQKHDKGYKSVFSDKESFLHFLKKYINVPWAYDISGEDMEQVDTSFITKEYQNIESDIIYKLKMNQSEVYFYILLELQSTVDHTMPFRLLRYMVALLTNVFNNADENERSRKGFRLPAIVPIVLYNGEDNWTAVRRYKEYTDNNEIFGDNIIDFEYLLFDLKRIGGSFILMTNKLIDFIFSLDMSRLKNDAVEVTKQLISLVKELNDDDRSELSRWIKYAGNLSVELEERLSQALTKGGANNMTHALEEFFYNWKRQGYDEGELKGRQEGWQEGRREGWQEGRQEGSQKSKIEDALGMIKEGISFDIVKRVTKLPDDEIKRLMNQ